MKSEDAWQTHKDAFEKLLKTLIAESRQDSFAVEARCHELQTIAASKDLPLQAACFGALRADALCELGRLGEAYSAACDALIVLREENDPEHLSRALGGLGLIQNELGDRGAAMQSLLESLNVAKAHGILDRVRSAHLNIGFIYFLEGCPEEALAHFQLVLSEGEPDFASGLATSNISSLLIDMGNLDEARGLVEDSLAVQTSPYIRGLLCGNYAMILASCDDEGAWTVAEQAVEYLLESGRVNYSPMPYHDIARIYLERGLGSSAAKAVSMASELSERQPSRPYRDEIRLLRAKILTLNGDFEEASRLLLGHVDSMQAKFAGQIKFRLELCQQRWDADWARKETELLRSVNRELTEARHEADRANAVKSQFLANMSHEIRTPLSGVIGMASLVLDTDVSDASRDYIQCIKSSGETLLSLINEILDLSKIEADMVSIEIQEFSIELATDDVLATMQSKALEKQIEFLAVVQPDVPRRILGDPDRIKQIWRNLIGNALKFTETGSVILRIGWEKIDATRGSLICAVHDTGIGIPQDVQGTIFESFAQAGASTSREYGGTGLGLTISRQLASAMGGELTVQSEVGKGSIFTCRLPVGAALSPGTEAGESEKCLIFGETPFAAESLRSMISALGFSTTVAWELDLETACQSMWNTVFVGDTWIRSGKCDVKSLFRCDRLVVTTSESGTADPGVPHLRKPFRFSQVRALLIAPDGQPPRPGAKSQVLLGRRFLVIEDNPVNQRIISGMLAKQGAEVEIVGNGQEGLDAMADKEFDVIFMDCQMPVMDGFECTRIIRQREQGTQTHRKIVATTASAMSRDQDECLLAGMDAYVSKPITPTSLLAVIGKVLRKRQNHPQPTRL